MREKIAAAALAGSPADLLTACEAAAYIGRQRVTIYAAMRRGVLAPAQVLPHNAAQHRYRFRRADLDAYRERAAMWRRTRYAPMPTATDPAGDLPPINSYDVRMLGQWRRYLGWQREDVAHAAGVSHSMISTCERGRASMRGRLINQIAHALDVPASILVSCAPNDERARADATRAAVRSALRRLERAGRYIAGEGAA